MVLIRGSLEREQLSINGVSWKLMAIWPTNRGPFPFDLIIRFYPGHSEPSEIGHIII